MPSDATHDFEWSLLKSFLAVARAGRRTLAARRLGLDHSTLSRRIAALEKSLQAQLFERAATGYTLTSAGEHLLRYAHDVESVMLRIHTDLAIGLACPEEGRLVAHKLTDYELGLYASLSYFHAYAKPDISSATLSTHRFVGYISDLIYARELDYLPLISPSVHPGFASSSLLAQLAATRAGYGLCILPCFIAETDPSLRRVLVEDVSLLRSFWLTVHADMKSQARVVVVSNYITQSVRAAHSHFLPGR